MSSERRLSLVSDLGFVIPTRNRAELLQRAVASLPAQSEMVIIDDGSSDDTEAVARALVAGRGTYIRLSESRGPCHARNVGVREAKADLLLFLDDDDLLLPGGAQAILDLAAGDEECVLFLHNCKYSDGRTSLDPAAGDSTMDLHRWLTDGPLELKPVVRRRVFDTHQFEDTGAGGEGLLWGKLLRERPALVGATPTVLYDASAPDRLTDPAVLLARAPANAYVAERWLEEFGDEMRRANPQRWLRDLKAAVFYLVVAGRRRDARTLVGRHRTEPRDRATLLALTSAPKWLLRASFRLRRHAGT